MRASYRSLSDRHSQQTHEGVYVLANSRRTEAQRIEIKGLRSPREAVCHVLVFGWFVFKVAFLKVCVYVYTCAHVRMSMGA